MIIDIITDIETLGTRPGCRIIEIGACALCAQAGAIVGTFCRRIRTPWNSADGVRAFADGPEADDDFKQTALWWLSDPGRRKTLGRIINAGSARAGVPIRDALFNFGEWVCRQKRDGDKIRIWGNGPTFDLSLLAWQYQDKGIPLPWQYRDERCVRTALDIAGMQPGSVPWQEKGDCHRALCDAMHEARKLYRSGALSLRGGILPMIFNARATGG